MGLFDEYVPDPPLSCPVCGSNLAGWQGKDGPRVMVRWRQGLRWPVESVPDQGRDEAYMRRLEVSLPEEFVIYAACRRGHWVDAVCRSVGGVWRSAEVAPTERPGRQVFLSSRKTL